MPKKEKKKKKKERVKTVRGHTSDDGRANWLESLKKGFWIFGFSLLIKSIGEPVPVITYIQMNIQSIWQD